MESITFTRRDQEPDRHASTTMVFVKDPATPSKVKAGDKVKFSAEKPGDCGGRIFKGKVKNLLPSDRWTSLNRDHCKF
jgi:hypothetical protein